MKEEEKLESPTHLDATVGNEEWKQSTRGGRMLRYAGPDLEGKHARSSSTRVFWDLSRWLLKHVMMTPSTIKIRHRRMSLRSTLAR